MEKIRAEYSERAEAIRAKYKRTKELLTKNDEYTEEHKRKLLNEAYFEADTKMTKLRKAYPVAKQAHIDGLVSRAFVCTDSKAKGEYLQAVTTASAMDGAARRKYMENALSIEAFDIARAVGRAAFNEGDYRTVECLANRAESGISAPVQTLFEAVGEDKNADLQYRMFTFTVAK